MLAETRIRVPAVQEQLPAPVATTTLSVWLDAATKISLAGFSYAVEHQPITLSEIVAALRAARFVAAHAYPRPAGAGAAFPAVGMLEIDLQAKVAKHQLQGA